MDLITQIKDRNSNFTEKCFPKTLKNMFWLQEAGIACCKSEVTREDTTLTKQEGGDLRQRELSVFL